MFTQTRLATFAECDPAGFLHFSRAACWVEEAEHAWLAARGFPVDLQKSEAYFWPRVAWTAAFLAPVLHGERLEVRICQSEVGRSSITWRWEISGAADGDLRMRGSLKTVCCRRGQGELSACPLPEALRD